MSGVVGQRKRVPLRETQARQRMWSCMQVMRRFTLGDIEATAEAGRSHCGKYIKALVNAQYLRVTVPKANGVPGGAAVYSLIRDTGPHAPRLSKDGIHDPNVDPQHKPKMVTIPKAEYDRALQCVRACQGMQDPEAEVGRLRELAREVAA